MAKTKEVFYLEYTYIIDADAILSQDFFDKAFADYLGAHGYEAQIVNAMGGTSRRLLLIRKAEVNIESKYGKKPLPPKSPKEMFDKLRK